MEAKSLRKIFVKYISMNVLGMIGISCYILADTFFVARGIGADGLAALNLAIPVYSFIHGIALMIGMGGATRYSISRSNSIFTQSLYLTLMFSAVFMVIGIFLQANWLASRWGQPYSLNDRVYLKVILCLAPAFMLNNLMICFIRNDDNPRITMLAMLLGSFSNIILDYVFIFIFNMGMFGAAIATAIAPIISLAVLSSHFRQKKNSFAFEKSKLTIFAFKDISMLGLSSLLAELSTGLVMIIFNYLILGLAGNLGVAAYGIIANIAIVIMSIFTGIAQGIQPILSKNYGEGKYDSIRQVLRDGLIVTLAIAILVYLASFAFTGPIAGLFNKDQDPQLTKIAVDGIRIYFIGFIFGGANILLAAYFAAMDRPKKAFRISVLRGFILIIPAALILARLFGLSGVWTAMPLSELIVLAYSAIILRQRRLALATAS